MPSKRPTGSHDLDVDRFYQLLVLHLRPYVDDPYMVADSLMPTLLAVFEQVWDEGHLEGAFSWASDRPDNPYGAEFFPDWPRRHGPEA